MKGYRRILIAVNGSLNVLRQGLGLASDEKCWVTVLRVLPPYEGDLNLTGIKNIRDVFESGREEVSQLLDNDVRENKSLARVRVEVGDIPETISRVASEENCDLIIIGKKQKTGWLGKFFSNNLSGKLTGMSPCPILFVET